MLEICRTNGILVLEDNPYGLLYFDGPPPHAMRSVEEDGVIYLGTFSKTLAPGFRVGWALAPHAIREKLILANEAAVLSPSSFTQHVITSISSTADWKGQIDTFRGVYRDRTRRDARGARRLPARLELDAPDGRVLRLGHPARQPRLQVDAASSGQGARRLHSRHGVLRRWQTAVTNCGLPSATRLPSSFARASVACPTSSTANSNCSKTFSQTGAAGDAASREHHDQPARRISASNTCPRHNPAFSFSPAASRTSATSRCAPGARSPTASRSTGSRSSFAIRMPRCSRTCERAAPTWCGRPCTARAAKTERCADCSTSSASRTSDRVRTRRASRGTSQRRRPS